MKKLSEILLQLEDFELAYLVKYRISEFMKGTQDKIRFEFLKRGLKINEIDEIISRKQKESISGNSKYLICNNCGSTKFYTEEYSSQNLYFKQLQSEDTVKETEYICLICNKTGQIVAKKTPSVWDILTGNNSNYDERID